MTLYYGGKLIVAVEQGDMGKKEVTLEDGTKRYVDSSEIVKITDIIVKPLENKKTVQK